MEFEEALYAWVATQAPLVAIIGEPQRLRFFKLKVEKGSRMPSMVQQRSGAARQYRSCTVDGAVALSMQIDHYGKTWQEMSVLARTFRRALDPDAVQFPVWMGGNPGDSPNAGVKVKAAMLENEFDLDDPDPGLLRRTQSWTFWIAET